MAVITRKRWIIAGLLAVLAFGLIVATLGDPGVTWDEPRSFKASRGYMAWLGILRRELAAGQPQAAFDDAVVVRWWVQDPTFELHPPVPKLGVGLGWALFRTAWGNIVSYRFSAAVWFAFLVALVVVTAAEAYGDIAGLAAGLSLLLMPRMFLHGHLANLDVPVTAAWLLGMYSFWRAINKPGWRWTIVTGILFGFALATKFNAALMPIVWVLWSIWQRREKLVWLKIVVAGAIGSGLFVLSWPWLYHDTVNRLAYYVAMGYRFNQTPQYYLGQTGRSPWHYPLVLTVVVLPLNILMLSGIGVVRAARERKHGDQAGFFLLNLLVPLLFPILGLQAAYSGERHFMPVFAYLAIMVGAGFHSLAQVLSAWASRWMPRFRWLLIVVVGILLALPPVISIVRIHPYELSYYSEIVGGLRGAQELGLETTFWCESYKDCLPYLNANAAEGALIWVDQPLALRSYQEDGMLRTDLRITGWNVISPYTCDYVVVQVRETGFSDVPELVDLMRNWTPEYTASVQGVPLAMVYKLR